MMVLSNGKFFRVTGPLWGNPPSRSFDVFFDLRLNKRLSKQSGPRWFKKPSRSLRCHCNTMTMSADPRAPLDGGTVMTTKLAMRFLARWLTSARAYRIGGRKLCPSVCLYVKRYLLLQFCTDYNQTWINMIWAVAAKTLLSQIFHNWRRIEVNCVYISHCKWYRTSAGMPACIPNRRCCAGQCAGQ